MDTNPFSFTKHNLSQIRIIRNGVPIVDYQTTDVTQVFCKTIQSLHFDRDGPLVTLDNYHRHFFMVFDLTSTQESHTDVYFPEIVGGSLKIELHFSAATTAALELVVLGEKLTTVEVDYTGKVVKHG